MKKDERNDFAKKDIMHIIQQINTFVKERRNSITQIFLPDYDYKAWALQDLAELLWLLVNNQPLPTRYENLKSDLPKNATLENVVDKWKKVAIVKDKSGREITNEELIATSRFSLFNQKVVTNKFIKNLRDNQGTIPVLPSTLVH